MEPVVTRRRPSRASIVLYTYSTIFEDEESRGAESGRLERETMVEPPGPEEYSVSEVNETFTIVQSQAGLGGSGGRDEDTDVEEDDDFDEYSEVTFEPAKLPPPVKGRKGTVFGAAPGLQSHGGAAPGLEAHGEGTESCGGRSLCHCAETYRNMRDKRRRAVSTVINLHQHHKAVHSTSDDTSLSSESGDELSKLPRARKKSKYGRAKEEEHGLVEGTFKLEANRNYEEYLAAIGTGPCSQDMVMRAAVTLTVIQDDDKQWRISNETAIKAKSVRGYRTSNRKWTENKFKAGDPKPELLDDWDQRLVVTTLTVEENGTRLRLQQVAEKDQMHCKDTTVELEVEPDQPEILIMTCKVGGITAWRRFLRQKPAKSFANRKISAPF